MAQKIPVTGFVFTTQVHKSEHRFKVPDDGCKLIGVWDGDKVELEIEYSGGLRTGRLPKILKSGREIYGPDLRSLVELGEVITVVIRKPDA